MNRVRALDSNGDWSFGHGRADYLPVKASLRQKIQCRLYCFNNDCFFDMGDGIDWRHLLGAKDLTALKLAICTQILKTTGVLGLTSTAYDLDPETRDFSATYTCQTIYSTLTDTIIYQGSVI
jgi:hypothetical protein